MSQQFLSNFLILYITRSLSVVFPVRYSYASAEVVIQMKLCKKHVE